MLLELRLPRVDGIEVLRALRANPRASATPVVVLLPTAEPREVAQCYQLGANSCMRKPVDFDEFCETIQTLGRYWLGVNLVAGPMSGAPGRQAGRI